MTTAEETRKLLNARCKFFLICGTPATLFANHEYLGRIPVCMTCYTKNPYIKHSTGKIKK